MQDGLKDLNDKLTKYFIDEEKRRLQVEYNKFVEEKLNENNNQISLMKLKADKMIKDKKEEINRAN